MLEIDILRNSSQNVLGVLRGTFYGFGCPKRHPDALLAKTMLYGMNIDTPPYRLLQCLKKSFLLSDFIPYPIAQIIA